MPRSMRLKPIVVKAIEQVKGFQSETENSLYLSENEKEIDESYVLFVEQLKKNFEELDDYRNHQINGDIESYIEDELIESLMESIAAVEKVGDIVERSERIQLIKQEQFWERIVEIVEQLEELREEVEKDE